MSSTDARALRDGTPRAATDEHGDARFNSTPTGRENPAENHALRFLRLTHRPDEQRAILALVRTLAAATQPRDSRELLDAVHCSAVVLGGLPWLEGRRHELWSVVACAVTEMRLAAIDLADWILFRQSRGEE